MQVSLTHNRVAVYVLYGGSVVLCWAAAKANSEAC